MATCSPTSAEPASPPSARALTTSGRLGHDAQVRSAERNELGSVLAKIDRILGVFDADHPTLTLADLMRKTGLAKSTVHRLVGTLVEARLLERDAGQLQLGIRLFELGQLVPRQRALRDAALPFMEICSRSPTRRSNSGFGTASRSSTWRRSWATAPCPPPLEWPVGCPCIARRSERPFSRTHHPRLSTKSSRPVSRVALPTPSAHRSCSESVWPR